MHFAKKNKNKIKKNMCTYNTLKETAILMITKKQGMKSRKV